MHDATFVVPKEGETYIHLVISRCRDLIDTGFWEGLTSLRLDAWMKNFKSSEEQYFAACLLDALIYRSDKQTIAMMEHLLFSVLPNMLVTDIPSAGPKDEWCERLRSKDEPGIRIVPVIPILEPPTKSGFLLARMYRQRLHLDQRWMLWPWQIEQALKSNVRTFLFVDDFLGTGQQFKEFIQLFHIDQILTTDSYVVYAPLVAHESGINRIKISFPQFRIVASEYLTTDYNLFASTSTWFKDDKNTPEAACRFHDSLVKRSNFSLPPNERRGYGELALAYAFYHATPDNCLPILWMRTDCWEPLLER